MVKSMNYPKILFISDEIPQSINAGSIQFFRLFQSYPKNNIIIFGKAPLPNAKVLDCEYYKLTFPLHEKIRLSRFSPILINMQILGLILPKLPNRLIRIANKFEPDYVVTLMQDLTYYNTAYEYSKAKNIPLIIFSHDDVEEFDGIFSFLKKRLTRRNSIIYNYAKKRICISEEMANSWQDRYKCKSDFLLPISSNEILPRSKEDSKSLKNTGIFTLGYAGSLSYGYKEGIEELIPFLKENNTQLFIYRENDLNLTESTYIKFMGFSITAEQTWDRLQKECDGVILPYSFEKKFSQLYLTHFPSKLVEYIELGLPTIVYGPMYANGIKWAQSHSILTATDEAELSRIMLKLLIDQNFRMNSIPKDVRNEKINHNKLIEIFERTP